MRILVSDTSVIVDLERGGLLAPCFNLPFEFAVPDLLYRRELEGYGGAELLALGLRVEELTPEEVSAAQALRGLHPRLSVPDTFAYAMATSRDWLLLSGDGDLRAVADANGVAYNGVLWVLDALREHAVVVGEPLAVALETIAAHPRCCLPHAEIAARLVRYRAL